MLSLTELEFFSFWRRVSSDILGHGSLSLRSGPKEILFTILFIFFFFSPSLFLLGSAEMGIFFFFFFLDEYYDDDYTERPVPEECCDLN